MYNCGPGKLGHSLSKPNSRHCKLVLKLKFLICRKPLLALIYLTGENQFLHSSPKKKSFYTFHTLSFTTTKNKLLENIVGIVLSIKKLLKEIAQNGEETTNIRDK